MLTAAEEALGAMLPPSLARFMADADAAEGWVGGEYFAMWPVSDLADLNRVGRIAEFSPGLVAFATNGGLDGYFFEKATGQFINSPMIGLGHVEATRVGATLDDLLAWLAQGNPPSADPPAPDPSRFGLVIHEIHPIFLGGSPTDPKNKAWLPVRQYLEYVAFWNEQVRRLSSQTPPATDPA